MNKREFLRLEDHERTSELERACRAVNAALNLFGRETVDELMQAAWDEHDAQRYIDQITTVGPDFSVSFVRAARPACNLYLRYARYAREGGRA